MPVIKIQKPLAGTDLSTCLLYAEDRTQQEMRQLRDLPRHVRNALKVHPKVYAEAEHDAATGWAVGKLVPAQQW